MIKAYLDLTKFGITIFILIAGTLGFLLGVDPSRGPSFDSYWSLLLALYFLSAASFILNQAQEVSIDKKMPRTRLRPLVRGCISVSNSVVLALIYLAIGLWFCYQISWTTMIVGAVTVFLYNGFYTLHWKPKMAFGAVPGAIPGALPVLLGYSASNSQIFSTEGIYIFMILFLWQMPHFWAIAIKLKDQYQLANVPVLPVAKGELATIYYIGLYVFAYVAMAVASPLFVSVKLAYFCVVLPMSLKVLVEFFRYFNDNGKKGWLRFFVWINVSVIFFMAAPVFDKWYGILA